MGSNWCATPGASPFNSLTFTMETIHFLSLGGLAVILTLVCLDAVISVSRRPTWSRVKVSLQLVDTIDRRQMQLPFVGVDRRLIGTAATENNREVA